MVPTRQRSDAGQLQKVYALMPSLLDDQDTVVRAKRAGSVECPGRNDLTMTAQPKPAVEHVVQDLRNPLATAPRLYATATPSDGRNERTTAEYLDQSMRYYQRRPARIRVLIDQFATGPEEAISCGDTSGQGDRPDRGGASQGARANASMGD